MDEQQSEAAKQFDQRMFAWVNHHQLPLQKATPAVIDLISELFGGVTCGANKRIWNPEKPRKEFRILLDGTARSGKERVPAEDENEFDLGIDGKGRSGIPEIESAGERFIAKGAILNGSSEEIWTIDECSLIDLDKHELKRLCELLRWKFFGYGIVSGGVRWNSVRNRGAGAQWSGVWRLRGTAGLRERLGGRQVASVELTAGRDE